MRFRALTKRDNLIQFGREIRFCILKPTWVGYASLAASAFTTYSGLPEVKCISQNITIAGTHSPSFTIVNATLTLEAPAHAKLNHRRHSGANTTGGIKCSQTFSFANRQRKVRLGIEPELSGGAPRAAETAETDVRMGNLSPSFPPSDRVGPTTDNGKCAWETSAPLSGRAFRFGGHNR